LLGPGDHFGALSLFYPDPHFSTATAFQASRLWIIRHEDFQARLRDESRMASALVRGVVVGIRMANAEIRRLTTHFNQRSHPTLELPASRLGPLPPPPPAS
jgi:CRP-like cAMP-binding protein